MGIFTRLSDIINSNIVHMLDKAENPEKMVRLMIQEMEDTLVEVKSQAARIIADKKTIERKIQSLVEDEEKWQEKAELAVTKNRDDLATAALEEKAKKSKSKALLINDLEEVESSLEKYKEDILSLEHKLQDAKNRQKSILMRKQTATSQLNVRKQLNRADSHKSFYKFEQFEKRIDHLEGNVEAQDIKNKTLEDEFEKLENESKIEEELKQLKEKMGQNKKDNQGES